MTTTLQATDTKRDTFSALVPFAGFAGTWHSDAVDHWVKKLQLKAPPWLLREHLRGTGSYEPWQLCDHQMNLRRLLFLWACDCRESGPSLPIYLAR